VGNDRGAGKAVLELNVSQCGALSVFLLDLDMGLFEKDGGLR